MAAWSGHPQTSRVLKGACALFQQPADTGTELMAHADPEKSRQHYRALAAHYDHATRFINGVRQKAIAALHLRQGDVVLDAGCGTGYCIPMLARAVGPQGWVIGFEHSPEMLAVAQERVDSAGLANVRLMVADAESFVIAPELPQPTAVLFSYVHDVMNSRQGLERIFSQAAPHAKVAACSTKLFPPWFAVGNWYLRWSHREYITNFAGFDAPWALLAHYLRDFKVQVQFPGSRYIATGVSKSAGLGRG